MQYFSTNTKNRLMISLVGVVGVAAMMLLVFGKETGPAPMVTDHLAFYPKQTTVYFEFAPGDAMARKMLNSLQEYHKRHARASVELGKVYEQDLLPEMSLGLWATPKAQKPGEKPLAVPQALSVIKTKPDVTLDKLVKDLALKPSQVKKRTEQGIVMVEVVLPSHTPNHASMNLPEEPIKLAFNPPAAMPKVEMKTGSDSPLSVEVDVPPKATSPASGKHPITKPPAAKPAPVQGANMPESIWMTVYQSHLVSASSREALVQAVVTARQNTGLLHDEAANESLHMLPRIRQGTLYAKSDDVLLSQAGLTAQLNSDPVFAKTHPNLKKYMDVNEMLTRAFPVTVGSLVMSDGEQLRFDFWSPVHFDKVMPEAFRADLQSYMAESTLFDTPKHLPKDTLVYMGASSLSKFIDLMVNHVATEEHQKMFNQVQTQAGLFGLDYRKNILGCLDGKLGLAVRSHEGHPQISVFFPSNPDTQKTMEQLAVLATSLVKATREERELQGGQYKMTLIQAKDKAKIAFGTLLKDTFTLGSPMALQELVKVESHQAPALVENDLFKTLNSAFPSKVNWVMFINAKDLQQFRARATEKVSEMAEGALKQGPKAGQQAKAALSAAPKLDAVEGIAAAGYLEGNKILHTQVHVKMAPGFLELKPTETQTTQPQ